VVSALGAIEGNQVHPVTVLEDQSMRHAGHFG
jgi:hypothetical protein